MYSPSCPRPVRPYPHLLPASSAPLNSSFSCPRTLTLGRKKKAQLFVRCRRSDYFDQQRLFVRPPSPPQDEPSSLASQPPGAQPSRVFVGYSIYKGKAALTVEPRAPEFAPLDVWYGMVVPSDTPRCTERYV
ncbi:hypothetical protein B296_00052563 [Ensete ventricosum]|uniref:Uncharacterized protein n=1 Tax=Ensete ventricosum TaxID=4639 RepID=A0A426YBU7_ENSVE|nr:hypothetical protein B296_00052563 [Ensete ventricosum]